MSTQSEKPQEGGAAVNGESSGAHSDLSETNNASVDVPSDTNTEASSSEGNEETPSNGSDKSESGIEHAESSEVQLEQSDNNNDSSDVNPEVVDFVNDVMTEVASQVEEKHGDVAVHDTTAQSTDSHGSAENGEYRPVVVKCICFLELLYTYTWSRALLSLISLQLCKNLKCP